MPDQSILIMQQITKVFDNSLALDHVDFQLSSGEILGLLGGNGAGKTTLMNILYGLYKMDSGEIFLHGQKVNIQSPKDALDYKIGMVHQHFLQIPIFSVLENIVLGTEIKRKYDLDLSVEEKRIRTLQKKFNLDVDLHAMVEDLPMGIRQKIEIIKALYRGAEILILDEPTTNLTPQEVDDLFSSLRVMVKDGLSVVFITHKLREVLSVCDRITVLRNGKNVITLKKNEASEEAFVRGMVGDEMDITKSVIFSTQPTSDSSRSGAEQTLLELQNVGMQTASGIAKLTNINLTIHTGEILGIAGVAGNGQHELAEAIMGVTSIQQGKVLLAGNSLEGLGSDQRLSNGMAYIPEDRLHDGFLPKASVAHNLILGYHKTPPYAKNSMIDWKKVYSVADELISSYNIKTSGPADIGGKLSGGNIQRVLIARAFSKPAVILVAHNPTRGLDIPSMDFVYTKLLENKAAGNGTILISEDLDELLLICDRIAVIYRGEIVGILNRGQYEKYQLGRMMSGYRAEVQ